MKKIIEVSEEGLDAFLGQEILVFGVNYIYSGILEGINGTFIKLVNAGIVYETGSFAESGYKDKQMLPQETAYVMLSAIESFTSGK